MVLAFRVPESTCLRTQQTRHGAVLSFPGTIAVLALDGSPMLSLPLHLFLVGDRRLAARARHERNSSAAGSAPSLSTHDPSTHPEAGVAGLLVRWLSVRGSRCGHTHGAIPDGYPPRPTPHNWMQRVRLGVTARLRVESLYSHLQGNVSVRPDPSRLPATCARFW